ncbi:MAG: UDP-N-acetylglucosamine--LPS N-acetylglucosamine transferase [Planctomycetota bacterium]
MKLMLRSPAVPTEKRSRRILAVASGGGHWVQLMRLRPALEGHRVVYVSTNEGYRPEVEGSAFHAVPDASRWSTARLMLLALRLAWIVLRTRPEVVISTGAAPGYFALRFGKWLGARTVWLDSIANVDELSLSGRLVERCADLWLTQWEHLAGAEGPRYEGRVL